MLKNTIAGNGQKEKSMEQKKIKVYCELVFSRNTQTYFYKLKCKDDRFPIVLHVDDLIEAGSMASHFLGENTFELVEE